MDQLTAQPEQDPTGVERAKQHVRERIWALLEREGGSILLIAGAYFTWQQILVGREGQVTERFTHAIDQIGNDASLVFVRNLDKAILTGAFFDSDTVWPGGFDPTGHGAKPL